MMTESLAWASGNNSYSLRLRIPRFIIYRVPCWLAPARLLQAGEFFTLNCVMNVCTMQPPNIKPGFFFRETFTA
jgi:hypothetical protein